MKTNVEIAHEVLDGIWGNGFERRSRLEMAGYDYQAVQSIVNALVRDRDAGQEQVVENPVQTVDKSILKVDVDLSKYDGVELNIIIEE